ncbi:MAG: hypothetical protein US83_C0001G0051 [Candidatus Falkowbacteria bacterium GW2011_GWC2_38_22]|uniref:Uncharacterized protein n=1 Tax=Candidatus Falkowbacteria bacterium GW2011_GWE1_38_31 TaxID=1618638 RepID=A0A0G0JWF6_9BACT|nr:MAG: hypothetical protein US73_C0004G0077 [Candidatus Falkowbacteria bacterium GW2011_GWF2_38_1205]KKQ62117.1 MAG: hypothetical protein US83_C0001G0051 [Candidatus Falkowbacteria bacterium GW2011_GWC2_38_22]KKQ64267.1 MAG: hypothetical protein US84_C0001G0051 [Candidatus Falkowbacteria bacterium GW2011_GWF1_38_22]KKQ66244.1 MAG: hypothetical protein US87_C0002G0051 [Candidatus Falkowbacteria bacterium GW2011_GWE2_38_254]KKQ70972.1 MAG: hypothetical protein US91_C0002G0051 [Candidatus Falkowb
MDTTDPKTGKRHKIFQDLIDSGKCVERIRSPLSPEELAYLARLAEESKEMIRRGEIFRKTCTMKFGGSDKKEEL